MEKKKNSAGTIALVVLLLVVTIASLVLATYAWAKYTSKTTGAAQTEVAQWDVTFSKVDTDFVGTYTHIATGKIAPGASGTFNISVNPGDTETCFDYVIKLNTLEFVDENNKTLDLTDTILEASTAETAGIDGVSANITLQDLMNHVVIKDADSNTVITTGDEITGEWHINDCSSKNLNDVSKTISWNWEYEGTGDAAAKAAYDAIDTAAGRYVAAGHTLRLKFNYTITATQKAPVRQ